MEMLKSNLNRVWEGHATYASSAAAINKMQHGPLRKGGVGRKTGRGTHRGVCDPWAKNKKKVVHL